MPEETPERPEITPLDWREVVAAWRRLPPEEQLRRRLARIPEKVARSMAFEGEPVDVEMLRRHLDELLSNDQPNLINEEQEK